MPKPMMIPDKEKQSIAGSVGIVLLLLAAMPGHDFATKKMLDGEPECQSHPGWSAAPVLHFYASSCLDADSANSLKRLSETNDADNDDDDEEERKRKRRVKNMYKHRRSSITSLALDSSLETASATSSSDHATDEIFSLDECSSAASEGLRLDDSTLELMMGYLPLSGLTACRTVSRKFYVAAGALAPTPLPGAIFLRFPQHTGRSNAFAATPPRHLLKWTCGYCGSLQNMGLDQCNYCASSSADGTGTRRLFLGQLRKDRTVELVDWLVAMLFPQMEMLHVENHTNARDGRGKGCAWAFVTRPDDEANLLSLNKRMFMDIDEFGNEGLWLCRPDCTAALMTMANAQAYIPHRPVLLPRQPLVVERPAARGPPSRVPAPPRASAASFRYHHSPAEDMHHVPMYPAELNACYFYGDFYAPEAQFPCPSTPQVAAPPPLKAPIHRRAGEVWTHDPYAWGPAAQAE